MLIIPSYSKLFDKNVRVSFFSLHFFPFYLLHVYPSIDFLSKYLTTSSEEIFFMIIEKPFTFFMVKKGIKGNHSNFFVV